MFKRFFSWLKSLFNKPNYLSEIDPDIISLNILSERKDISDALRKSYEWWNDYKVRGFSTEWDLDLLIMWLHIDASNLTFSQLEDLEAQYDKEVYEDFSDRVKANFQILTWRV